MVSFLPSAQDEFAAQASTQQQRLAEQSRTVSDDLQRISRGERPESDMVIQAVSSLAQRADSFTRQLETKEPADLLDDVRRFASRRPGTFLLLAAGAGLLAGRLTRGMRDAGSQGGSQSSGTPQSDSPTHAGTRPVRGTRAAAESVYPGPDVATQRPGAGRPGTGLGGRP